MLFICYRATILKKCFALSLKTRIRANKQILKSSFDWSIYPIDNVKTLSIHHTLSHSSYYLTDIDLFLLKPASAPWIFLLLYHLYSVNQQYFVNFKHALPLSLFVPHFHLWFHFIKLITLRLLVLYCLNQKQLQSTMSNNVGYSLWSND